MKANVIDKGDLFIQNKLALATFKIGSRSYKNTKMKIMIFPCNMNVVNVDFLERIQVRQDEQSEKHTIISTFYQNKGHVIVIVEFKELNLHD